MIAANRKPWLTASEQIDHLKSRGVHFSLMSEDDTRAYLENLYKFCTRRFNDREMLNEFYIIQAVKSLRNACAHNNCILNNLSAGKPIYEPWHDVMQELSGISSIGPGQRRAKMSNDRMQQIVTTLYTHRKLASRGVSEHRADSLALFVERMNKHVDYYCGNLQVSTGFEFLAKVINAWFPAPID